MRLIDADVLLKHMETTEISQYINEINKGNDNYSSTALYGYIKEMPTAYDVDKVVERLKQIKTDNSCKNCTYREKCDELQEYYNPNDEVDLCALVAKELSIEIVKSGGIE